MRRLNWIDVARGIGVILVVLGHLLKIYVGIGQWIYSFHMPLFFIISGMLFDVNKEWKKPFSLFCIKKIKGIMYPYLTISILNILYDLLLHGPEHAIEFVIDTITLNGILALWFLPALFFAELILYLWNKLKNKNVFGGLFLFFILLITSIFFSSTYESYDKSQEVIRYVIMFGIIICRAFHGFIFMALGYLCVQLYKQIPARFKKRIIKAIIIAVFAITNICLFRYNRVLLSDCIIGNPILYYLNALCGSFFIIGFSNLLGDYLNVLCFYGKNSLIIFSTHLNFGIITIAKMIWRIDSLQTIAVFFIVMVIETIIALLVSKFFSFIISYNDFKTFILRIKKRVFNTPQ